MDRLRLERIHSDYSGRHQLSDREVLELILELALSNATALSDLQASVAALEAAAGNAPTDVSAGIEAAATAVDGVTSQLGGTPPVAGDGTVPSAGSVAEQGTGTELPPPDDPGAAPA